MSNIIYIFHPFLEEGKDHKTNVLRGSNNRPSINAQLLIKELKSQGVEGEYVDMYEEYPNFVFDQSKECARILKADNIILIHPMYWISIPSLMKEWIDYIFQLDFVFGKPSIAGKKVIHLVTAGLKEHVYSKEGSLKYTVDEFFRPISSSWEYMKLDYKGLLLLDNTDHATDEQRQEKASEIVSELKKRLFI